MMGIINSMKQAISGTAAWLRGKGNGKQDIPTPDPVPVADPDTPPIPDTSRYRHVSVPLYPVENPVLRKLFGVGYTAGRGQTHNIGNNRMKREADRIAEFHGLNNKQRIRLRSRIKRRAEELRSGQATLTPGVREAMRGVVHSVVARGAGARTGSAR